MKNKNKHVERESRSLTSVVNLDTTDDRKKIVGSASLYEQKSNDLGGFYEIIKTGAFDNTDISDVRALFNHDPNIILGRSTNDSLKITVDERGLHYEITPPDTQTIRDLVIKPLEEKYITQSSFAFTVENDKWYMNEEGEYIREITAIGRLYDVSPVTYPAYENTASSLRSLDKLKAKISENEKAHDLDEEFTREREIFLLNLN